MKAKFIVLIFFIATACRDDFPQQVPNVYVNEYVYLSNPSSQPIQFIGGWIYHDGGYSGLVIYRRYNNGDSNDWVAYDRACPDHYNQSCGQLEVTENLYLTCACDQTEFLLFDGSVTSGYSSYPLVRYRIDLQGNALHIHNY